jgi:staphylococcal nuclease domain-containing protein 1
VIEAVSGRYIYLPHSQPPLIVTMSSFLANVKSVLSGDTLVLTSPNNPSAERTLSLAYVSAPRLSKDGDEPYAFQSREFLRALTVGKPVKFSVSCK